MVTSSYPRYPGDGVGSFIEPIAKGVAARGHEVHIVAPWHPAITRGKSEDGVFFHFYHYAPVPSMNVFGYAEGLKADTHLKIGAWAAAPAALAAGWFKAWRVAAKQNASDIGPSVVSPVPCSREPDGSQLAVRIWRAGRSGLARQRHASRPCPTEWMSIDFGRADWSETRFVASLAWRMGLSCSALDAWSAKRGSSS
jgi:hypothetical protein